MIRKTGIKHYLRRPEFIVVYSLITLTLIAAICSFPNGTDEPVETNLPSEPTEVDGPTEAVETGELVEPPPTEAVRVDEQGAGLALEIKRDIANAFATLANISNFDLLDTGDFKDPIIDNWLVTTDSNGQAQLCPSGEINRGTQTCNDNACHIYIFEGSDFGPYACPESGMGDMCSLVGTSTFDDCHYTIVTLSANVSGLGTWFAVTYLWDTQMTVVVAGEGRIEVTPIVELVFDGGMPPLAQMGPQERARAWGGTNIVARSPGSPEAVFTDGRGDAQFFYTAPNASLEVLPIDTAAIPPRTWQSTEQLSGLIASLQDIEPQLEPWLERIWENSRIAQIDLGPFPEEVVEDLDGDGLTNIDEAEFETDPLNPDSDEDQLTDGAEVLDYGTDPLNPDSDNDGLSDGEEMFDYGTDPLNPDTDSDGLVDGFGEYDLVREVYGANTDPHNPDSDSDRLTDGDEMHQVGTNPLYPDSDDDQLTDGQEVLDYGTNPLNSDSDGDGLSDYQDEYVWVRELYGGNSDPNNPDTDGDRLIDGDEMHELGTNPLIPDTDDDGLTDGEELLDFGTDPLSADTDRDGLTDGEELFEFGTDPLTPDTDGDRLTDVEELFEIGTDPTNPDTDGDEFTDGEEVFDIGTDPLNWDSDGDGLSDGGGEYFWVTEVWGDHSDPLNPDTDDDGYSDGEEMEMDTNPLDPYDPYIIG